MSPELNKPQSCVRAPSAPSLDGDESPPPQPSVASANRPARVQEKKDFLFRRFERMLIENILTLAERGDGIMSDLRYAVRTLLQQRGWAAVVVTSLAFGIGANTALFSSVNSLLLETISVADPDGLVRLRSIGDSDMAVDTVEYGMLGRSDDGRRLGATFSYPTYQALRAANETLTDLFAAAPLGRVNVVVDGEAEIADGFIATGNFFDVVGLPPAAGRLVGVEDDRPSAPPAAVISYGYWERRFGLSPDAIGKVITVNSYPVTIVGVTSGSYAGVQVPGGRAPDVHLPLALNEFLSGALPLNQATFLWLEVMGRLKPGTTAVQVRDNLNGAFRAALLSGMDAYLDGLSEDERSLSRNQGRSTVPELHVESGSRGAYDPRPTVTRDSKLLGWVVALLLVIVCANVANLLLSRGATRAPEIAVRLSIGATRSRLVRQLVTEGLLLSAIGGALGLVVAYWTRRLLPHGQDAPLDARVLSFVALLCVVTAIAFSLVPALSATRLELSASLKQSARHGSGYRSTLGRGLLALQVALSVALLTGAGLFLNTLRNLRSVDVGFDPTNILLFRLDPRLSGYEGERMSIFYEQVRDRLASLHGVRSAAFSHISFLTGRSGIRTAHFVHRDDGGTDVHVMVVSPEFFETLGIQLLAGRVFTERDTGESPPVAIFNAAAVREFFADSAVIGERFGFAPEDPRRVEIVGVVADTKYRSVRDDSPPTVYIPYRQTGNNRTTFEVKTTGDPRAMVPEVRRALREIDPNVPLISVSTQAEQIEERFRQERAFAIFYTLFGAIGMLLAAIGLFGLSSYDIVRRTREIGIRLALGAQRKKHSVSRPERYAPARGDWGGRGRLGHHRSGPLGGEPAIWRRTDRYRHDDGRDRRARSGVHHRGLSAGPSRRPHRADSSAAVRVIDGPSDRSKSAQVDQRVLFDDDPVGSPHRRFFGRWISAAAFKIVRRASLTASSVGKASATSGARRARLVPAR